MNVNIQKTISKIITLTQCSPEFKEALYNALDLKRDNTASVNNERIERIEKYLGLDYIVDTKKSTIDYSFVEDEEVREILISDNREMMRNRYGTRYHKIDFTEFCRCAHLQAEMLINYYYDKKNGGDLQSIKNHIKTYNQDAKIEECKSLSSISYNIKMYAYRGEYKKLSYRTREMLDFVRDIRNELSHRTPKPEDAPTIIEEYQKKMREQGYSFYKDGQINGSNEVKQKFNSDPEYKRYHLYILAESLPYDGIIKALIEFTASIKQNLV